MIFDRIDMIEDEVFPAVKSTIDADLVKIPCPSIVLQCVEK